ncbi:sensor domain-containing diguanylate cyclase [Rhizobium rosettiformans]|uniref:sensor domain-containing diguanylate cyclase n=1 Tax=Rhizobium rosettiformans TaxID=1368430 RepID=UPI00286232F1|nr:diguanylate cyclase [Rhizobium rosettiformans]MDR7031278.1 diguanylate cyclase (GGDEF)-like protein [Rhizobium rosettiformans]MDR7067155.1 diguanylate cyclase (GGDEF)-like protein [Rhizobium rosettiformans]
MLIEDTAPVGLAETDLAGAIVRGNPFLRRMIGVPDIDELVGQPIQSLLSPLSRMFFETQLQHLLHLNGHFAEVALQLAGSDVSDVLVSAKRHASGMTFVFYPASARRNRERELAAAKASTETTNKLLSQIETMASIGGWTIELPSMQMTWSNAVFKIYDLPPGEPLDLDRALDAYPGQARAEIFSRIERTLSTGKPFDHSCEFIAASGKKRWVRTLAEIEYFAGKPARLIGVIQDVTAQRALQSELAATQALLQTAMNEMADGLAMFDQDGRLTVWNKRYTSLFSYVEAQSCRGRTLAEILSAGVLKGEISIPPDVTPAEWVEDEVQRSVTAEASELLLSSGRWVSKKTTALPDGGWVTLYADITEKKAAIEQLEGLANKDGLTGIANRRCFNERLDAAVEFAKRSREPLSLLMVDVDHFKAYNDTYGHPAGDEVLRALAKALQATCRGGVDLVARYGGEEFAVILPGAAETVARKTADRIAQSVRELEIPHVSSDRGRITVSIGISSLGPNVVGDPSVLLETGDKALYAAKCAGRDTVRVAEFLRELSVSA